MENAYAREPVPHVGQPGPRTPVRTPARREHDAVAPGSRGKRDARGRPPTRPRLHPQAHDAPRPRHAHREAHSRTRRIRRVARCRAGPPTPAGKPPSRLAPAACRSVPRLAPHAPIPHHHSKHGSQPTTDEHRPAGMPMDTFSAQGILESRPRRTPRGRKRVKRGRQVVTARNPLPCRLPLPSSHRRPSDLFVRATHA